MPLHARFAHWQQAADEEVVDYTPQELMVEGLEAPEVTEEHWPWEDVPCQEV